MPRPELFTRTWAWSGLWPRRVARGSCAMEALADATVFTPLFPQPGVRVPTPDRAFTLEVAAAGPNVQLRMTAAGHTPTDWKGADTELAEALQRLDWRGVLALSSAPTADRVCAVCAEDDQAVDEALGLEHTGNLRVRRLEFEGAPIVVIELPIATGRFELSRSMEAGACVGVRIDIREG